MRHVLIGIFIVPLFLVAQAAQAQTAPAAGDPAAGQKVYSGAQLCGLCHGNQANGGFGPDIAGRNYTGAQVKRAIHQPWGIMPRYPHLTDKDAADLAAFLNSRKPAAEPGKWSVAMPPAGAPKGQQYLISFGCGQCHGPENGHPRRDIGAKAIGFDYNAFAKIVYEHAPTRMGLFSPDRLPEPILREIYEFSKALGWRVLLFAETPAPVVSGENATYTVKIMNRGMATKGLTAGDLQVNLVIPKGLTVVSATGEGYKGVSKDVEYITNPGRLSPFNNPTPPIERAKGDVAIWKLAKVAPGQEQSVTVTLTGPNAAMANFTGSTITFGKPENKPIRGLVHLDHRIADKGDVIRAPSQEWSLPPNKPMPAPKPASNNN